MAQELAEITLQLGESVNYSGENMKVIDLIPLSHVMLEGSYIVCGNITTLNGLAYHLDFDETISEVSTKLYGVSYNVEVGTVPLEIYLKVLEELDILSYTFSIIRTG